MSRTRLAVFLVTWIVAGCGSGATGESTIPDPDEPPSFGSCTGPVPADATPCPGSDAGLAADAVRTVKPTCTCEAGCRQTPCSYACNPGFTPLYGMCAPVGPPSSISLVQGGDGTVTVTDESGTLVWLRDANCTETVGGVSREPGPVSWYEAADWAGGLASGACGLSDGSSQGDWRLPDEFELATLAADLAALGEEGRTAFSGIQERAYWTSFSTCAGIYGVIVVGTGAYSDVPAREPYDAWPVRRR
jgi:hypothetical protein